MKKHESLSDGQEKKNDENTIKRHFIAVEAELLWKYLLCRRLSKDDEASFET